MSYSHANELLAFRSKLKTIVDLLSSQHREVLMQCQHLINSTDEDMSIPLTPPINIDPNPWLRLPVTVPRDSSSGSASLRVAPPCIRPCTPHSKVDFDLKDHIVNGCEVVGDDMVSYAIGAAVGMDDSRVVDSSFPFHSLIKIDTDEIIKSSSKFSASLSSGDVKPSPKAKSANDIDELYARDFNVKEVWLKSGSSQAQSLYSCSQSGPDVDLALELTISEADFQYRQNVPAFWRWVVASPGSQNRIIWELFGMLLVLYDLITIPLLSVFSPPDSTFIDTMEWLSMVFWTVNVGVVLTTGFIMEDVLVLKPIAIFKHYLKTWFVVDLLTLLPDWFFTAWNAHHGTTKNEAGSFVKLLRVVRLFRLGRLARLVKLRNIWHLLVDCIKTETLGIGLEVLKMVCVLMMVNHYVACVWFGLGKAQDGKSWLKRWEFTEEHVTWVEQYLVSYHWSITQFTPSSMHVQPECIAERVFAIITIIFALVGFSYLVGSITGSLQKLRSMGEKKSNHFWLLRRFLLCNSVPKPLAFRIKAYAESAWDLRQSHTKPENVEVLGLLSDNLRAELAYAIHGQSLCIHPLFEQFQLDSSVTVRRLAFRGISQTSLARADMMFYAGEEAEYMTIVTKGILQYHRVAHGKVHEEIVEAGEDWIAEPVLWVDSWLHLGELKAQTSTELLHIIPELFNKIIDFNPIAFKLSQNYARGFHELLRNCNTSSLSDITQGEDVRDELWEMIGKFAKLSQRRSKLSSKDDLDPSSKPISMQMTAANLHQAVAGVAGSLSRSIEPKRHRTQKEWRKKDIIQSTVQSDRSIEVTDADVKEAEKRKRANRETDGDLKNAFAAFSLAHHFHLPHFDFHLNRKPHWPHMPSMNFHPNHPNQVHASASAERIAV